MWAEQHLSLVPLVLKNSKVQQLSTWRTIKFWNLKIKFHNTCNSWLKLQLLLMSKKVNQGGELGRITVWSNQSQQHHVAIGASSHQPGCLARNQRRGGQVRDNIGSEWRRHQECLVQHLHQTEQGGEDKGEPEHQVDLLVDDVDGQGADAWSLCDRSADSKNFHLAIHHSWKRLWR